MKLTFVSLCAIVLIKLHEGSILNKIRYFRSPHYPNSKLSIFRTPVNYTKPVNNAEKVLKIQWFYQRLDNFNASDTRQWKMRYLFNDQFFERDGPLFIIIGGLREISTTPLISGHVYDLSKKYNAIIFHTEHRYYGQSQPTLDLSIENLKYLTSRQALADLAQFIESLKGNPKFRNSKVILYGSSYGGSLVVWFRRLYPHLIDGGWASSAPILAVIENLDFPSLVGSAIIERSGFGCYQRISNGFNELQNLYKTNRSDEAKRLLRLCNNFNKSSSLDISSLFLTFMNVFKDSVQANTIFSFCANAELNDVDGLKMIANYTWHTLNFHGSVHVSYDDTIGYIVKPTKLRLYYYQLCNEFGWFIPTSVHGPFGEMIDLDLYIKICQDAFGLKYNKSYIKQRIAETNRVYGGLYPNVTNIYFTKGSLDPWRYLGHPDATIVQGAMQSEDTLSVSSKDTPEMKDSKVQIYQLIEEWIGQKV